MRKHATYSQRNVNMADIFSSLRISRPVLNYGQNNPVPKMTVLQELPYIAATVVEMTIISTYTSQEYNDQLKDQDSQAYKTVNTTACGDVSIRRWTFDLSVNADSESIVRTTSDVDSHEDSLISCQFLLTVRFLRICPSFTMFSVDLSISRYHVWVPGSIPLFHVSIWRYSVISCKYLAVFHNSVNPALFHLSLWVSDVIPSFHVSILLYSNCLCEYLAIPSFFASIWQYSIILCEHLSLFHNLLWVSAAILSFCVSICRYSTIFCASRLSITCN